MIKYFISIFKYLKNTRIIRYSFRKYNSKARDKTIRFLFFQKSYSLVRFKERLKKQRTFFSNWNRSRNKYLELSDSLLYCTHNGGIHTRVLDEIRMGAKTNTVSTAYKFTRFVFREHPSCLINFAARYDSLSVNVYAYVNYRTSIVTLVPDNRAFVERNL